MTKLTPLRSIENGLHRALSVLGDHGAEDAIQRFLGIRRSASLLRKCADPDDDHHQLQMRYAIALDAACKDKGSPAPLLDSYRYAIENETGEHRVDGQWSKTDVTHEVLVLQVALGELAEVVNVALEEESPNGVGLSNSEKQEIFSAIDGMEVHSETLKNLLAS